MMDDDALRALILRKMLMHRWIGGKHTAIDNLPKGFPPGVRNDVSQVVEVLIREGFIVRKPINYREQVYLSPKRVYEAKKIVGMV